MNIYETEECIKIVRQMLHKRPDLCPHKWQKREIHTFDDGHTETYYHCKWCGQHKLIYKVRPRKREDHRNEE